jgi:hypothetical protein
LPSRVKNLPGIPQIDIGTEIMENGKWKIEND